ncbi:PIR Superfamily Protein [Plasmodium ovale curtisi]|uniref:PIR Superfamily Protein n=1 Tax=Plasmodium ovale curtisi TaxID=864141 RepID=A0A1A8WMG4_PLAOA|nr:PIR Superfamily Protein [Plasmodium ovale curtisi]
MLKDVFTDVLTVLYVINPVILNFFLINSEKDDRVVVENKGEKKEARGDKEKREDKEDEEDEEEEEEDEDEEEEEDEDDEEDGDEDEKDEDEEVVDGDCDKILPELGSSNCHVHKMNLCQTKDIKLLCDYLESYADETNKLTIANEISKSNYCSSFNKIINWYNDKTKCQGENFENEYCPYIKRFRNKYSHETIETLKCTVNESSLSSPEHYYSMSTSQVKKPNTGDQYVLSDSLPRGEPDFLESLVTEILDPETSDNNGAMSEKQAMEGNQSVRESHHAPSQITPSSEQDGSDTMISTSSTSCPHSSRKESCDKLLITSKFTPIGSKINNRKRKKHIWKMNEEQYDQLLMYNPEIGNTNSNNNKYNIRYYSLINS